MSGEPLLSVLLAARDAGAEIAESARSVLAQREVALELLVVDDGSRDATAAAVQALAERDPRVRLFRRPAAGLTAALAFGAGQARGELLARQDAGDASLPGRFARQAALLAARPEVAWVSCWTELVGPGGEPLGLRRCGLADESPVDLAATPEGDEPPGPSAHGSVVMRRALYERAGGYRPEFRLAQDWDLWWRLAEHGRFAAVAAPLYRRRLTPGSLSFRHAAAQREFGRLARAAHGARRRGAGEAAELAAARRLAARLDAPGPSRDGDAAALYHVASLLRDRRDRRAVAYFRRAAAADPRLWKAWLRWLETALRAARWPTA